MGTIEEMFSLKGKTAIITGAGGGIGKSMATHFAKAGANVVIAEINGSKLSRTVAEINAAYDVSVVGIKTDVQDTKNVARMVEQVQSSFNTIDILVNNAGIGIHKLPQEMSIEEWDLNISVNLRSVFICSNAVYPVMKAVGFGKIINMGSMYATFGAGALSAYAASKGGVVQLTRSLAIAWAPDNIQVNALCPGFINTDLSTDGKRDIPGMAQAVVDRTPIGRWGEPEDCAGAAIFLAGSASDFITGASLPVDGGYGVM